MKNIFNTATYFMLSLAATSYLQAATVTLEDNDGSCAMEGEITVPQDHTIEATGSINAGWDSDKYMVVSPTDTTVKISYTSPVPISIKIDKECGGSGIYRKADGAAINTGEIEVPIQANEEIHIGLWDWESGSGYDYQINITFADATDTQNEDNTTTTDTDDNATDNDQTDNNTSSSAIPDIVVYEDAENGNIAGWTNLSTYSGFISNITQEDGNHVISLSGNSNGAKNRASYILQNDDGTNWNNKQNFIATWDMQTSDEYEIFFVSTSEDDPTVTNYIGYVSALPTLTGYTFNPSTGYWQTATGTPLTDWGRYSYIVLEPTPQMTTITRNLQEDAQNELGIKLTSIDNLFVNVYGDSSARLLLDNITLKREESVTNTPPVAQDLNITLDQNSTTVITLSATDTDGDILNYQITSEPQHGTLVPSDESNTSYTYTPQTDYNGTDTFTYIANDGTVNSEPATVSIMINPVTVEQTNHAPIAEDLNISVDANASVTISLYAIDEDDDNLTFSIITQPSKGSLTQDGQTVTYTPNNDANGSDSFTYQASDTQADSNIATVSLTINPVTNSEENNTSDQNDNNTSTTISIDENSTDADVDDAGMYINLETNQTVQINGTLDQPWDMDRYSFISQPGGKLKISPSNNVQIIVLQNLVTPLQKTGEVYSFPDETILVTVIAYAYNQEESEYTITLEYQ